MNTSMKTRAGLLLVLAGLCIPLSAASCGKDKTKDDAKANAPKDATKTKDTKQGATKTPPKTNDSGAPGVDTYPGFPVFGKLNAQQRTSFKAIAEAELCPCPNSTVSLHVCLKKKELRCSMADRVSMMIAGGVVQGVKQNDILAGVAKYIASTKKVHTFKLDETPYMGNPKAKIVFVEFADFQCPHCRLASGIMKKVVDKHKDEIVFYYKHFPLGGHPQASIAAAASLAAHKQGKFWPMHDLIFANQSKLSDDSYTGFAKQIGLNLKRFDEDMKSPVIRGQVMADKAEGEKAQLTGTPTLYVNGRLYMGEKSVDAISAHIAELKKAPAKKDAAPTKDAPAKEAPKKDATKK